MEIYYTKNMDCGKQNIAQRGKKKKTHTHTFDIQYSTFDILQFTYLV